MNILLIEDERPLALAMVRILNHNGYRVHWSSDGQEGFEEAKQPGYDLIILDILLPGKSGWNVCGELRAAGVTTPILVVSAMDEMTDKVKGLNLGADDYLAKPFESPELVARVKALLRREEAHRGPIVIIGDLEIDRTSRSVTRAGEIVALHADEYELLEKLAVNEGTVQSKAVLAHCLESVDPLADEVDERVASLRKKVDMPFGGKLIQPLGDGYILVRATLGAQEPKFAVIFGVPGISRNGPAGDFIGVRKFGDGASAEHMLSKDGRRIRNSLARLTTVVNTILVVLALAQGGLEPTNVEGRQDFLWSLGLTPGSAKNVQVVAIVKPIETGLREKRDVKWVYWPPNTTAADVENGRRTRIDVVEVLDGYGAAQGEKLRLVSLVSQGRGPDKPALPFKTDKQYLVIGLKPEGATLVFPSAIAGLPEGNVFVPSKEQGEVSCLMAFETRSERAPSDGGVVERVIESALGTLDVGTDAAFRRVVHFLGKLPPDTSTKPSALEEGVTITYCKPGRLTALLESKLASATPFRKSKIRELLLRWRVPGSNVAYRDSLVALICDRRAYSEPEDVRELLESPPDMTHTDDAYWMEAEPFVRAVLGASNEPIRRFVLEHYRTLLSDDQCSRLASLLDHRDPYVRYLTVYILYAAHREQKDIPGRFDPEFDEKLAQAVDHWKERYRERQR